MDKLPEAPNGAYNNFFKGKALSAIPKPPLGEIVTVKSTDNVRQAARTLAKHAILSAPVRDVHKQDDAPWLDKYIGTVDAVNLTYWLLEQAESEKVEHLDDLLRLKVADTPVTELVSLDSDTARFNPFIPLAEANNTMLEVMLLLGKYAQHRAYVVEPGADISNVITQSALVKFLADNLDQVDVLANSRVGQLPLSKPKEVVSVSAQDTFWDAFKLMKQHHVSAVPMLNGHKKIEGVVSVRDARQLLLQPTRFRFMRQPLELFENLHVAPFDHKVSPWFRSLSESLLCTDSSVFPWLILSPWFSLHFTAPFLYQAVCCKLNDTLRDVIDRLLANSIHRLFMIDDDDHVIGVVALRDVIALFVKEPADSSLSDYFAEQGPASLY
eukprot:TRINITY_DN12415_c4_g2_i8.p1 TRINITY_DN12415_c4_g2~~TRINITY_DN12415_c4_g2_i8.p1  ORF type:complete len:383 (+),score=96.60 TRINITY_DN12415_c4_g2_i8:363-1511(+)